MATRNGTYVYCLVRSARRPSMARVPRGLPGAGMPRALDAPSGTWLIVSDVPLDRYNAEIIDDHLKDLAWVSTRALAHERVVEFCARSHDVVPMKLFTIFRDDERARSHVGGAAALASVFRRISGCSEWSVRVSCSAAPRGEPPAARDARRTRARVTAGSGTAFLRRKKSERDDVRSASVAARDAVEAVFERLDRLARQSIRKGDDLPGTRLLLDAAFLVPRKKQATFERQVARLAASSARAGCELVLSGPWPPYHFVSGD